MHRHLYRVRLEVRNMFSKKQFSRENNDYGRTITTRKKNQNSSYLKQLKPMIVALKLLGVFPITEDKNGPAFSFFSWIMLYSLLFLICMICLILNKFYRDYKYFSESSDLDLFDFLTRIAGSSITLLAFTIPFFWMDMKKIPNYWNRWNVFQDKFESCMQKSLQLNVNKRVWAVTIVPTALMTFNIVITLILVKVWRLSNSIVFIIIFAITNLSTGYFYVNCHIFRNISKDINQRIMEIIVKKKSAKKLREHAELWCHMSHLITDFGIIHSGMHCSIAIVMYIVSTITLFITFTTFISPESYKVSAVILPVIFANSILMIYSESAYVALSQVGPKLPWKVLNSIVYGLTGQTQREVQDFLEMIQLCKTNITFGGYCNVNRQLFPNFLVAVTFNLVVVFQSQIIPKRFVISD